jgi:predicted KAP-like P-loop ATPase
MTSKQLRIAIIVGMLLMASNLAVSVLGQDHEAQQKAAGAIQYRLVAVPSVQTQAQLQAVMTAQGNAGWRYVSAFAVGTGPIPTQEVLLFSKP